MNKLKVLSIITLVLMILPAFAAFTISNTALAAAPSIETSADAHGGYFTNNTWVEVKVVDTDRAGQPNITVNLYVNGEFKNTTTLKAVGTSGVFMGYIVYNKTNVNPPFNPVVSNFIYLKDLEITLTSGDKLTIEYVGAGGTVSDQLTFKNFTAEINFDRDLVPIWNDTKVYVYVHDQDYNYDPTKKDTISSYTLTIEVYDVLGYNYTGNFTTRPGYSGNTITLQNLEETGPNTATFMGCFYIGNITSTLDVNETLKSVYHDHISKWAVNLTDLDERDGHGNLIAPFDHFKLIGEDDASVTLKFFTTTASLEEPTEETVVSLETELIVTVSDSDMNLDTKAKDTYGVEINNTFIELKETGANTGVFTATIPVTYTAGNAGVSSSEILVNKSSTVLHIRLVELSTQLPTAVLDKEITSYPPELSVDKTSALPIEKVKLTLVDHDLNDKGNDTSDSFGFAISTGSDFNYRPTVNSQGRFMVYINDELATVAENAFVLFEEKEPGVFEVNFDLGWIGGMDTLKDGDNVTFIWEDLYNGVNATAKVMITKPNVAISLDRDVYPMPNDGKFYLTIDVYDPYANQLSTLKDHINSNDVRVIITQAGTNKVIFNNTADARELTIGNALWETDVDTGVFEGTAEINLTALNATGGWNIINYTGATIKVIYKGLAEDTATIRPSTAVLTVNGTDSLTVNMGDNITITLVEPDENIGTTTKDKVNVTVNGATVTLQETGLSTGVFTATLTVGKDAPVDTVVPGHSFKVEYTDEYTAATSLLKAVSKDLSATVSVASHTAQLIILPEPVNGEVTVEAYVGAEEENATLTFRVNDIDEYFTPNVTLLIRGTIDEEELTLTPVKDEPGLFNITIPVILNATGTRNDGVLEIPNSTGSDTLVLRYTDAESASGASEVLTEFVKVTVHKEWVGHDGQLYIFPEKPYYNDGDELTIYLYDPDTGGIPNITITSWRMVNGQLQQLDPLSLKISLQSNGTRGWYIGYYVIKTHDINLFYEIGDYLKISYKDPYAASGPDVVTAEKVLPIGFVTPTPVQPPSPENVTFKSTTGEAVTPHVGTPMLVDIPVTNAASTSVTVDIVLLVYTPDGVPVGISYGRVTLSGGQTTDALVGWLPTESGTFHIKVFFWDLANKKPLSEEPLEFNVTVE